MNNGYGQPQHYQQYAGGGGGYQQPQQMWQQPDQHHQNQYQQPHAHQPMMYQQQNPQQGYGNQQYQRPGIPTPMGRGAPGMMPGYPQPHRGMPGMSPGMHGHGMPIRPAYTGMPMPNYNPPSPPMEPEEDDRDPRLDDPWLIEFVKKNEKPPRDETEWSAHKIKARLREVNDNIQKLRAIQTQIKDIQQTQPNSPEIKTLEDQAKIHMVRVEEIFVTINPADPAFERFRQRMKKNNKHQMWLRKARARVKVDKKNKTQKTAIMNRLIDEWQSKLITKDVLRRKGDENRKQKKLQEKQRQIEKKEAIHVHDVLLKLEELRALRAQTLELEDQQVSTTPLLQVLQQYIKDNPIQEEDKKKAETEDDKMEDEEGGAAKEEKKEKEEKEEDDEEKDEDAEVKPITEEDVRKYYEQAYESVDRLVAVRRAWDQFVVPTGFGTRIPPTFITPPTPTRGWRKYLKKKKKKKAAVDPSTLSSDLPVEGTQATTTEPESMEAN